MTPVSLALDLLLIGLLLAALIYGFRLERRLKTLREGQEKFVKTVRELDGAAGRAEAGLSALKATAEEVGDTLHGRILAARELAARLEKLIEAGASTPTREAPTARPAAAAAPTPQPAAPIRSVFTEDDIFVEGGGAPRRRNTTGDT